jgi:hypothetical protein
MKFQRPKSNYHVVLQQRLLGSGDAEFIQIGSDLGDFHQERIQADYHMNDRVAENPHNAAAAVKKARRMIDASRELPSPRFAVEKHSGFDRQSQRYRNG